MNKSAFSVIQQLVETPILSPDEYGRAVVLYVMYQRRVMHLDVESFQADSEIPSLQVASAISRLPDFALFSEEEGDHADRVAEQCAMLITNTFVSAWCDVMLGRVTSVSLERFVRAGRLPEDDAQAEYLTAVVAGALEFAHRLTCLVEIFDNPMHGALWLLPFYDALHGMFSNNEKDTWDTMLLNSLPVYRRLERARRTEQFPKEINGLLGAYRLCGRVLAMESR